MDPGSTRPDSEKQTGVKKRAGEGLSAKGNQNKRDFTPVLPNKISKVFCFKKKCLLSYR